METLYDLLLKIIGGADATTLIQGVSESTRGHICEAIVRISLCLHIHPKTYDYVDGLIPTPRSKRLLPISDSLNYLKTSKINNSSNTGKIDAAWTANGRFTLVSSKIKNTIASLDDLDVTYLDDCIYRQKYTYNVTPIPTDMFDVCVFVLNKEYVLNKLKTATTNDVKTRLDTHNIYDVHDLDLLCKIIEIRACGSVESLIKDSRKHLNLRFHQELIYRRANAVFQNGRGCKVLVGAIPRSGKTYIGAKLCTKFSKVLVITTRPSETKDAWLNVFKEHREFSDYAIHELTTENEDTVCSDSDKCVIIASKQFFDQNDVRRNKTFEQWDVILIDEIHEGGCTDLFVNVLSKNTFEKTHHIMMTATYEKPVLRFNIPTENQFYWDLEDVRLMKAWGDESEKRLIEKYGDNVLHVKSQFEKEKKDIASDYTVFPDPVVLTTSMHEEYYKDMIAFNLSQDETEIGFSMRSLFMPTKDGKAFQNPKAVQRFLELVSGSTYEKTRMSMFDRIQRVWNMYHHRDHDTFKTMMWFLPYGEGQRVDDVKACLSELISKNAVLKNYNVMLLDSGMTDIKNRVKYAVEDAKISGKDGVILLTGDVGSLGLSLPEVDVVFLLNNIDSTSKIFQQMMRSMTEQRGKKCGIIVDFNVWRILNTLSTYAIGRCGKVFSNTKDKIRWCITNLIRVDVDLWECDEAPTKHTKESLIEHLSVQWTRMMENTGLKLSNLQKQHVDIGEDQKLINNFSKFTTSAVSMEVDKEFPDGISETRSEGDDKSVKEDEKKKELPKNININDILARLIPDIALLSGGNMNLAEAVKYIDSQPHLRNAMSNFLETMSE